MLPATERYVGVNGVRLRVLEAGPPQGPLVILAHGFPELAYSWRHQIPPLAAAGYHVIAPDQRGYGGSSRPAPVEAYDITALTGDLVGLIDEAGADRAAIVGHDWGGVVAWSTPLLHPDRVAAVAGLSVPPIPRPRVPPTAAFRRIFGDNFFYILYFQQPGAADAEMAADPRRALRRLFGGLRVPGTEAEARPMPGTEAEARPMPGTEAEAMRMLAPGPEGFIDRLPEPGHLPDWLTPADLDTYVEAFSQTGFTGPLNWYRNFDRNWDLMAACRETLTAPALFVGGTADPTLAFTRTDRADEVVKGPYRQVLLEGAGHWIQQERPAEVTAELLEFLGQLNWS